MEITVVNLQRKRAIEIFVFREYSQDLRSRIDEAAGNGFAIALISDGRMRQLNKFFRGKDFTTDVLSFPHEPDEFELNAPIAVASDSGSPIDNSGKFLGDIVISVEQAARQADENGLTLEVEIKQLILHGLLHLCGYDHETDNGEMNARELELRERLGL